jgi:carboxylesterase type B
VRERQKVIMSFLHLFLFFIFLTYVHIINGKKVVEQKFTPVIETSIGPVRGMANEKFNAYLGVPFGETTAGPNRWKNPIPKRKSNIVFNATSLGNACPGFDSTNQQWVKYLNLTESEDCLNINIWQPSNYNSSNNNDNNTKSKKLLPVLVWIYGGGFLSGTNADPVYNGQVFVENFSVIVVNFNYRLGALGFMASSSGGSNFGLRDQSLALDFVRSNILKFGGDPKRVTIFGQSAGAMSVLALVASPTSVGKFQRALSFSPVALTCRSLADYDTHTNLLFKAFNCNNNDYSCMRKVPYKDILKKQVSDEYIHALKDGKRLNILEWIPACDMDFLPTDPTSFLLNNYSDYSKYLDAIVIGNVKDEMAAFIPTILNSSIASDLVFNLLWSSKHSKDILKLYEDDPITGKKYNGYEKVMISLSDYLVACYTKLLVKGITLAAVSSRPKAAVSNNVKAYLYEFHHTPSPGADIVFGNMKECGTLPCHASDNVFNFGSINLIEGLKFKPNFTKFEQQLSLAMMSTVVDFASGGSGLYVPYNISKDERLQWGGIDKSSGGEIVHTRNKGYRSEYCNYWEEKVGYGIYS